MPGGVAIALSALVTIAALGFAVYLLAGLFA